MHNFIFGFLLKTRLTSRQGLGTVRFFSLTQFLESRIIETIFKMVDFLSFLFSCAVKVCPVLLL